MRLVGSMTSRARDRQWLSAAFNLNTPLSDDLSQPLRRLRDPVAIARRSIELVRAGGFDKVAWDSASTSTPSTSVFDLLPHADLVQLVHTAHSAGIHTYVSGGVTPSDVRRGVHAA